MTLEIFLFVLNFVEFTVNLQTSNESTTIVYNPDDLIVDNITGLRTKRYYTRWGGDVNSEPAVSQFLVKVYDEDASTAHSAPQSVARPTVAFQEPPGKLQLGGVKIPTKTHSTELWEPADLTRYSRFMPPMSESGMVKGSDGAIEAQDNFKDVPFPRLLSHLSVKRPQLYKSEMTPHPVFGEDTFAVPERSDDNWRNAIEPEDVADNAVFHVNDQPKRISEDESLLELALGEKPAEFLTHNVQSLVTPIKYHRKKMPAIVTPNAGYRRHNDDDHFLMDDFLLDAANGDEKNDDLNNSNDVTREPIANQISHPDLENMDDIDVIVDLNEPGRNEEVKLDSEVLGQDFDLDRARPGDRPGSRRLNSNKPIKNVGRPPHEPKKATHSHHQTEDINIEFYIDKEERDGGNEDLRIDSEFDGDEEETDFNHAKPPARLSTKKTFLNKPIKKVIHPPHEPKRATFSHHETEDINIEFYIDKEEGENGPEDIRIDAEVHGEEREFGFTHTRPGARPGTSKPTSNRPTKKLIPSTRHPGSHETEDINLEIDINHNEEGSESEDVRIGAEVGGEEHEFDFTHPRPEARPGTNKANSNRPTKKLLPGTRQPGPHESEDINVEINIDHNEEGGEGEDVRIGAEVDGDEQEFDFTHRRPGARPGTSKPTSNRPTKKLLPSTRHPGSHETEDMNVEININKNEEGSEGEDIRIGAEVDGDEQEFEFTHTRPPGARPGTRKPNSNRPTKKLLPSTRHPGSHETEDINVEINIDDREGVGNGQDINIDAEVEGEEAEFNFTHLPQPGYHSTRKPIHKTTKKNVHTPREPSREISRIDDDVNIEIDVHENDEGWHIGAGVDGKEKTTIVPHPGHTTSPHHGKDKAHSEPSMYSDNEEDSTDSSKHKTKEDQPRGSGDEIVSADENEMDKEALSDEDSGNSENSTKSKPTRTTTKESTLESTPKERDDENTGTTAKDVTTSAMVEDIDEAKSLRKFQTCNVSEVKPFTFLKLHNLEEVMGQIRKWGDNYPVAKTVDISNGSLQTYMGNTIIMLTVDDRSQGQDKTAKHTVLIVAGIQGRDHHSVAASMYLLYELIERGEHHKDLLTKFRFWVIPVLNPDGYRYSMSFPNKSNWRKNMRQMFEQDAHCENYGFKCMTSECIGVHLDRNFDYQWVEGENLSQLNDPCSEWYPGPRQLSEPETRMLTRYLNSARMTLHAFIALKEGDVLGVMFPYSHTRNVRTTDFLHRKRAQRASMAARSIAERHYVFGQTSQFLPLYAGGIEDWVEGHLGVDNSYSVTLYQPNSTNITIEQVCHEGFAAIDTLLLTDPPQSQLVTSYIRSAAASPPHPPSFELERFGFKSTERTSSILWMFVCYIQIKLLLMLISDCNSFG